VRLRAAQDGGVKHVGELDVVDKRGLASKKPDVFLTPDRSADISLSHGFLLSSVSTATSKPPYLHHQIIYLAYFLLSCCCKPTEELPYTAVLSGL
jgi:hypothetical protein